MPALATPETPTDEPPPPVPAEQPGTVMRQPKAWPVTQDLALFLELAVPLISADLAWQVHRDFPHNPEWAERWLLGVARRGAMGLGHGGDALQFANRSHQSQTTCAVSAQQVAEAVAAVGLLAGDEGVTVWGAHFCRLRPCPHQDGRDHLGRKKERSV